MLAKRSGMGSAMGLLRTILVIYLVIGLAVVAEAEPSASVCRDGACFPPKDNIDGVGLTLHGVSTFRYWGLRVYTAALYMPAEETSPDRVLAEIPKKLVLRYHRSISVDQFVEKSEETLRKHPQLSLDHLSPFLLRIKTMYVPVKDGDSYAITYHPAQGALRLFFNERLLGTVTDHAFARAYFGIWVSDYSVSERFTDDLLGRSR